MAETVGERLRRALEERDLSVRAFARQLAGTKATGRQWENKRRQLTKWLDDEHVPTPQSARLLENALGLPAGYLVKARPGRAGGLRAELALLHERLDNLEDEISLLRDELGVLVQERETA